MGWDIPLHPQSVRSSSSTSGVDRESSCGQIRDRPTSNLAITNNLVPNPSRRSSPSNTKVNSKALLFPKSVGHSSDRLDDEEEEDPNSRSFNIEVWAAEKLAPKKIGQENLV